VLSVQWSVAAGQDAWSSTSAGAPVLALRTEAALDVPVNACRLALHGAAEVTAAAGDPLTVELGDADGTQTVFTGTVSRVAHTLGRVEIEGAGAFSRMAAARLNLLYEQEAAGNVASDVFSRLELAEGTVESGITFPVFALHAGATVWAQLHELARRCGFDLWADVDDRAHFRACEGGATHALTYGTDLLAWEHAALEPAADGVLVLGESPAGQGQSDDATSWLTKKEVQGTAGATSGRVVTVVDPAARNQQLAGDVAKGWMRTLERTARGRATTLGLPAVQLGDALRVSRLPASAQGAEARVTGVRHRLDARGGFVTTLAWERV
jgi:hypothetical protein